MTTITTPGHQRTPLIAALAAGAALVVGGALGAAWEHNNSATSVSPPPPAATHSGLRDFQGPQYYHGQGDVYEPYAGDRGGDHAPLNPPA
jgi:hypothetical protein